MFPNFRMMGASTLASIVALFFAFGVYASLRVSHEPLVAAQSRSAPLQLVGLNAAMLPVTVLEPFARQPSGRADGSPVLAYSNAQTSRRPLPVTGVSDTHEDNAAAGAPTENGDVTKTNSDVTQAPDTASLEAAGDTKSPEEAMQESVEPAETLPPNVTETAALPAPMENVPLPASLPASPPRATAAAPAPRQNAPVEQTAAIETMPAANASETAGDSEIPAKEKKKKRAAKRHFYHAQPRAVAQTSPPQVTSYPAGIGGPFVSAPKH
jgi:hypothetical protein